MNKLSSFLPERSGSEWRAHDHDTSINALTGTFGHYTRSFTFGIALLGLFSSQYVYSETEVASESGGNSAPSVAAPGLINVDTAYGRGSPVSRSLVQWTHARLAFGKDIERIAVGKQSIIEVEVIAPTVTLVGVSAAVRL